MDAKKPIPKPTAAKPAPKAANASSKQSAKASAASKKPVQPTSFMNWLGRQVGHVTSAVKTDVTKPAGKSTEAKAAQGRSAGKTPTTPTSGATATGGPRKPAGSPADAAAGKSATAGGMVIYREDKVEEAEMPDRPGVILRRTIIDEVVVETPPSAPGPSAPGPNPTHPRQ